MAQAFDVGSLEFSGEPHRLAEEVFYESNYLGVGSFSASNNILAYSVRTQQEIAQLAWVDRQGRQLESIGEIASYGQIALSPDETRLIAEVKSATGEYDLWSLDLSRQGVSSRITFTPTSERDPVWSPDGLDIIFSSSPAGRADLYRLTLGQDKESVLLVESEDMRSVPEDWSTDGRFIIYGVGPLGYSEIRVLPLADGEESFPVVQGAFDMDEPHFSPDGGWIAYESNESGQIEVYVQPFQEPGEKMRISNIGGNQPRWRGDGRELFYLAPDGTMMAVEMNPGTTMQAGIPKPLFQTGIPVQWGFDQYVVTSDGQRFLTVTPVASPESGEITVVTNWTAELDR